MFTRIARLFIFTRAGIVPIDAKPSPCSLDARSRFFLPRRGLSRPYFSNGGADGWREGCLQAGAMTATQRAVACRRGRREAVSVTAPQPVAAQDAVIFNEPGRRARVACGAGGDPVPRVHAPAGYGIGAALQITALVWLPGSKADTQPRNEVRSVASAVPSRQPSAEPMLNFRGRGSSGESRQRERGLC